MSTAASSADREESSRPPPVEPADLALRAPIGYTPGFTADKHRAEAGLQVRPEAFVDMLEQRAERSKATQPIAPLPVVAFDPLLPLLQRGTAPRPLHVPRRFYAHPPG